MCDMHKHELMKHAAGIGVETRRRGTDGKHVFRQMADVRRDCVLKAQSLAGPVQVSEVVAGGGSCSDEQFVAAGEMSYGEASCAGGGSCSGEQFVAAGEMLFGEASCARVAAPRRRDVPGASVLGASVRQMWLSHAAGGRRA